MSRLALPLTTLAAVSASVALAACGSSGDDKSSASGGTRNAQFAKYQQCLKDNGVTLPDRRGNGYGPPPAGGPGFGDGGAPQGVDHEKFQKAMQACQKYRPQGAGPGGNGQRPQQDVKAFTPYLNCLKSAGLDIEVSDGFNALRNLEQTDPKVHAALKSCQSKLPQRPAAGTSTTGTT